MDTTDTSEGSAVVTATSGGSTAVTVSSTATRQAERILLGATTIQGAEASPAATGGSATCAATSGETAAGALASENLAASVTTPRGSAASATTSGDISVDAATSGSSVVVYAAQMQQSDFHHGKHFGQGNEFMSRRTGVIRFGDTRCAY